MSIDGLTAVTDFGNLQFYIQAYFEGIIDGAWYGEGYTREKFLGFEGPSSYFQILIK